jgi:hypothetical protein
MPVDVALVLPPSRGDYRAASGESKAVRVVELLIVRIETAVFWAGSSGD